MLRTHGSILHVKCYNYGSLAINFVMLCNNLELYNLISLPLLFLKGVFCLVHNNDYGDDGDLAIALYKLGQFLCSVFLIKLMYDMETDL